MEIRSIQEDLSSPEKTQLKKLLKEVGELTKNTPEGIAITTFARALLSDQNIKYRIFKHDGWELARREELEAHVESLAEACMGMLAFYHQMVSDWQAALADAEDGDVICMTL